MDSVAQKPRKTRTMSPDMLAKLAEARKKALEVKKRLKEGGNEAKMEHLQAKMSKLKPKPKPEIIESAEDEINEVIEKEKKVKTLLRNAEKPKAKTKVIYQSASESSGDENDSDTSEEEIIIVKKKKPKSKKPKPKPKQRIVYETESEEEYSDPPLVVRQSRQPRSGDCGVPQREQREPPREYNNPQFGFSRMQQPRRR